MYNILINQTSTGSMNKKSFLLTLLFCLTSMCTFAQRNVDKLDRGLIAIKASKGVYLNWRINGDEYYDVTYNVYRDGTKIAENCNVSNYTDATGTISSKYSVSAVVNGKELEQCKAVGAWSNSYREVKLTHADIASTLVPNDACCADVDGDGEVEILMKYDNLSEIEQAFPKAGPTVNGKVTGEYTIFEVVKLNGTRLWWVNCGPNMGDFQNNEQNIVGYDWDQDGKAEVVMRLAEGSTIHYADGTKYTIGANGQNGGAWTNYRAANGGGANWFVHDGKEFFVYCNGETGKVYQCMDFPLARLESGESNIQSAWGDGTGHRCSKFFFGAPYLDGRKPSIFLARGIYTRHKMAAYDVDPATHKLTLRWKWYNNTNGPWKGQGYHNYAIADVDWDGRDEIVYGSMVIDDNGKGLSTSALGHGDASHCGDFNPYIHGQEIFACNEDAQGYNYRDATTSKIYKWVSAGKDVGRSMCGNFSNDYPGCIGTAYGDPISTITLKKGSNMVDTGINQNMLIYWDGDLCSETFNYLSGKNTEGCVAKYGSWTPIYTCTGSMTNNDTKGTPCYQGDILGDWREEIIMRTSSNNIRIYSTPTPTQYRNYSLWYDHQYRNAMVWQMCGYNQPPHASYFLGELEGITIAPPPLTMTGREEVANGGTIGSALNGKHAIVCETGNTSVSISEGATPSVLTFNVPTWVQGSAPSECTTQTTQIKYTTYTCDVQGSGLAEGNSRLVKQGDGILNLPNQTFNHKGNTDIWAGTLNFDGKMKNSPLWLNRFAELNSKGEFRSIKADYASVIRPGGANSMGTLTVDTLSLNFGSRVVLDLYSEGTASDNIKLKYLNIEKKTGTAWTSGGPEYLAPVIELVGHLSAGEDVIAPGKYVIAEIGEGVLSGNVSDIIVEGLNTTKKLLYVEDKKLILEVVGLRDAGTITWSGSESNIWDLADTKNFSIGNDATTFVSNDNVNFNDDSEKKTVSIKGSVIPAAINVNTTGSYIFSGTGTIDGAASFTKEGTGSVTMSGKNTYTGGNHLLGGTTKVSLLSNQYSEVGNLGAMTSDPNKFTIENGAVLQATTEVEMGSPIKLVGTEGGVINNANNFRMDKSFSGTLLTKKGSGCLFLNTSNSVSKIAMTAGSMALSGGSAPATIELQGGTLYDDAQNTGHTINVPAGKSASWHLSYTYYTAYNNKITGEGTLTIVPRNTVSRVRIIGDWSAFKGTIKHNTSLWFPLDNSKGIPNGTFDIASGCVVKNTAKTFRIGKLTGEGSLAEAGPNFQNQTAVSGNNTWEVGNSLEKGDFTFGGTIDDAGGSNKCVFKKVGTCKMTTKGVWTMTGAATIAEGELHFNSNATLGKGALTVSKGAKLSGASTTKTEMTNSSFTFNGIIQPGSYATSVDGFMAFNGKNVTFNKESKLIVGIRRGIVNAGTPTNTYLTNIATLKMADGAIIAPFLSTSYTPTKDESVADEFLLWTNVKTPNIGKVEFELPELPGGNYWDTSNIANGILYIRYDKALAIGEIASDEVVNVKVTTTNGVVVDEFTCPMGSVNSSFSQRKNAKGIYILNITSENGKKDAIKKIMK